MTVFTETEFRAQMELYLDMGMTYAQAYRAVTMNERAAAEAMRTAELELAD
jgi:hypothetical protein